MAGNDIAPQKVAHRRFRFALLLKATSPRHIGAVGYACRMAEGPEQARSSATGASKWLPRQDSNLDRVDQNHLCYHYTTG